MKILFDCHTFDCGPQGTTTFLAGLINALPNAVCHVMPNMSLEMFCAAARSESVAAYITVPYRFQRMDTGFLVRNLWCLPTIASRIEADVVVSQYVRPAWVPRASVSVIHDVLFLDFPDQFGSIYRKSRQLLFGLSAKHSSKIFTVSEYSQSRISAEFGLSKEFISILPNAVPARAIHKNRPASSTANSKRLRLLYVSRLEKRKRHEWCVRALVDLLKAGLDVELTLVGSGTGPYAIEVQKTIYDIAGSVGDRLVRRQNVSEDELDRLYDEADIFLFPSLGEGFGVPVIEAASHGLPCIVTDGSALSELKGDFVGLSFPPLDYEAFLASIIAVYSDFDSYRHLAQQAQVNVYARYNWDRTGESFLRGILQLGTRR